MVDHSGTAPDLKWFCFLIVWVHFSSFSFLNKTELPLIHVVRSRPDDVVFD